jgi:hypothetical protein
MPRVLVHLAAALVLALAPATSGCKAASAPAPAAPDLDADPVALLPSSALVVASLDARAMFASAGVGSRVTAMTDSLLPLGPEAGVDPKRDVDHVVVGVYTSSGADVAAVVSGRFDPAKIDAATRDRSGAPVLRGMYAGHVTYTAGPAMYAVLSPRTVVAGTGDGLRRLLERVQDARVKRATPAWVDETLSTPGADLALTADFTSQPFAAAALGSVPVPWISGMRVARVIGNFAAPGMNFAATVSYGDPQQASGAAGLVKVAGPLLGGQSLQKLDVVTDGSDLKCKFALDEQALGNLLAFAPPLLRGSR